MGGREGVGRKEPFYLLCLSSREMTTKVLIMMMESSRRMEGQFRGRFISEQGLPFVTLSLSDFSKVHEEASHTGSQTSR